MNAGATMECVAEPVKILLSAMPDKSTMMVHTATIFAALRRVPLIFIVIAISAMLLASCATVGPMPGVTAPPVPAQPGRPLSLQLVPEHVGVQVLAFVAKPEQLTE